MANQLTVYICDDAVKAQEAKDYLLENGFAAAGIICAEQVNNFTYDAATYDGGGHSAVQGKWVVIGKN